MQEFLSKRHRKGSSDVNKTGYQNSEKEQDLIEAFPAMKVFIVVQQPPAADRAQQERQADECSWAVKVLED